MLQQLSLFDDLFTSPADALAEKAILHGSGFAGGKQRIFEFVQSNHSIKELAAFLKNEYGFGGWASPRQKAGEVHDVFHDGSGIEYQGIDRHGNAVKGKLSWSRAAEIVLRLVDRGEYLP